MIWADQTFYRSSFPLGGLTDLQHHWFPTSQILIKPDKTTSVWNRPISRSASIANRHIVTPHLYHANDTLRELLPQVQISVEREYCLDCLLASGQFLVKDARGAKKKWLSFIEPVEGSRLDWGDRTNLGGENPGRTGSEGDRDKISITLTYCRDQNGPEALNWVHVLRVKL